MDLKKVLNMADKIANGRLLPLGLGASIGLVLVVVAKIVISSGQPASAKTIAEADAAFARKDYAAALNLLRPLADRGDAMAQHALATYYKHGLGVERDQAKAANLELLSATQGYAKAESALGAILLHGDLGLQPNEKQAMTLFQQAADQDDAVGQYYLGAMYASGRGGVAQDDDQAMNYYLKAADQNNPYADFALGVVYENGKGVPKARDEALNWFRKAAQNGDEAMKKAAMQMIASIEFEQPKITEMLSNLDMHQLKMLMKTMSIMNCGEAIGTKYSMTNFIQDKAFQNTPWPQVVELAPKVAMSKCGSTNKAAEIALD
jgi:TPR repeat protein